MSRHMWAGDIWAGDLIIRPVAGAGREFVKCFDMLKEGVVAFDLTPEGAAVLTTSKTARVAEQKVACCDVRLQHFVCAR